MLTYPVEFFAFARTGMRIFSLRFWFLVFALAAAASSAAAAGTAPKPPTVVIALVQTAGEDERVILRNLSSEAVDLGGWSLRKCPKESKKKEDEKKNCRYRSESESVVTKDLRGVVLGPGEEFLWRNKTSSSKLPAVGSLALFDNSDDGTDPDKPNRKGKIVSAVSYGSPSVGFVGATAAERPSSCQRLVLAPEGDRYVLEPQERPECRAVYRGEKVRLNELLPDPVGSDKEGEFVELYNAEEESVSLTGWRLFDGRREIKLDGLEAPAGGYVLVGRDKFSFSLANDEDTIKLIAPDGTETSVFSYRAAREGEAFAYSAEGDWRRTTEPTPGGKNVFPPPPRYDGEKIFIEELLPNPVGEDAQGEFIELRNPQSFAVSLSGWKLTDASGGEFVFPRGETIPAGGRLVVYRSRFSFALNNSGREEVRLLSPTGEIVSAVVYERSFAEGTAWARSGDGLWRGTPFLTPGAENIFPPPLALRRVDIERKIYRGVPANFAAAAEGSGRVKITWDFGDGHRSRKAKTRHKYAEKGTFTVVLRVADDWNRLERKFQIKVKKYPERKVKISLLEPNPAGRDKGKEYLQVINKSSRRINLKGWSVAVGTEKKKLRNHPIGEKLIIHPGKRRKIFSPRAKITLPNRGAIVELRRPDGEVADRVVYRPPAGKKSIPEGAVYHRRDKRWQLPADSEAGSSGSGDAKSAAPSAEEKEEIAALLARARENEFGGRVLGATVSPEARPIARKSSPETPWRRANLFLRKILEEVRGFFRRWFFARE